MIHYLLDELYTYKESYSDALCHISHGADESHLGEVTLVAPHEARCMMYIHVAATYTAVQKVCALWASSFFLVTTVDTHCQSTSIEYSMPEKPHQPPQFSNNTVPVPSYPPPLLHDASISRGQQGVHNYSIEFEMQTGQLPVNSTNPLLHMAPKDPSRIIPPITCGPDGWKQVN